MAALRVFLGLCSLVLAGPVMAQGPFPPQAGEAGSTAIHKDAELFRDWAVSCAVVRGWQQLGMPDSGYVDSGTDLYAIGPADAPLTVTLGDSGYATLTFTAPFHDGEGADFAVFENGFGTGEEAFLELAFVEVSSDGVQFFRFPSESLSDTTSQTEPYGYTDASYIHNLAGKYTVNYGVPFDLADLPDTTALNKQQVTHVRIVDAVGSIDPNVGTRDGQGRIINDPWPTNFAAGGFDLDAVGIINSNIPVGIPSVFPYATDERVIACRDLQGRLVPCTARGPVLVQYSSGRTAVIVNHGD